MSITVVAVGKIKETYLDDAISDFMKQIAKSHKIEILEVPDEKTPDNASEVEELKIKQREGEKILKFIRDDMYVFALAIEGVQQTTEEFREKLKKLESDGIVNIGFVIGGSLGLSQDVMKRANYKISYSKMTFPHQLMRVILLEQLNRCV